MLPTHVIGQNGLTHEAYLTPRANGINCYGHVHGAAWLGTIKLPSNLLTILRCVWGQKTEWITLREFELYSVLQFLARGNSRRFDSPDQVRYVVADYVQAAYIAEMWNLPVDRVKPLPMRDEIKKDLDDHSTGKGGRRATVKLKEMTPDEKREYERQRKAKQRKKAA